MLDDSLHYRHPTSAYTHVSTSHTHQSHVHTVMHRPDDLPDTVNDDGIVPQAYDSVPTPVPENEGLSNGHAKQLHSYGSKDSKHRFEILRKLGSGTYGKVSLAYDHKLQREVSREHFRFFYDFQSYAGRR